jgi:hypothetical protein
MKTFGDPLQGNGLAGAGRAGNQPVAIGHLRQQIDFTLCFGDKNGVRHGGSCEAVC